MGTPPLKTQGVANVVPAFRKQLMFLAATGDSYSHRKHRPINLRGTAFGASHRHPAALRSARVLRPCETTQPSNPGLEQRLDARHWAVWTPTSAANRRPRR